MPGRSRDTILVVAHRDSTRGHAGTNDNASGTAALIELARAYSGHARRPRAASARTTRSSSRRPMPAPTGCSARGGSREARPVRSASSPSSCSTRSRRGSRRGSRSPATGPRSPAPGHRRHGRAHGSAEETGRPPETARRARAAHRSRASLQPHEQDAFLAERIPALTVTTEGGRAGEDSAAEAARRGVSSAGSAALRRGCSASLDARLEPARGNERVRLRRRAGDPGLGDRAPLHRPARSVPALPRRPPRPAAAMARAAGCPAVRSYVRRLGFWLFAGSCSCSSDWSAPGRAATRRPSTPPSEAASHWPRLGARALRPGRPGGWVIARGATRARGPGQRRGRDRRDGRRARRARRRSRLC